MLDRSQAAKLRSIFCAAESSVFTVKKKQIQSF